MVALDPSPIVSATLYCDLHSTATPMILEEGERHPGLQGTLTKVHTIRLTTKCACGMHYEQLEMMRLRISDHISLPLCLCRCLSLCLSRLREKQ